MENKEELIISAINELKDEQKETRKEISTMNKALASLASYHQRLNNLEENVKDLPKIRLVTNALVWALMVLVGAAATIIAKSVTIVGG